MLLRGALRSYCSARPYLCTHFASVKMPIGLFGWVSISPLHALLRLETLLPLLPEPECLARDSAVALTLPLQPYLAWSGSRACPPPGGELMAFGYKAPGPPIETSMLVTAVRSSMHRLSLGAAPSRALLSGPGLDESSRLASVHHLLICHLFDVTSSVAAVNCELVRA
jgi:hypothetical protein